MGYFDNLSIGKETNNISSTPSDNNYFSSLAMEEATSKTIQPTSIPSTSSISDEDMYSALESIKLSTDAEDSELVRYAYGPTENISANKDVIKTKLSEINKAKELEKLKNTAVNVQSNIDAIYNKYNLPSEIGSLVGNKEAQDTILQETNMLRNKKIQELQSLGIQAYFQGDKLFVVNEANESIPVDSPDMFKQMYNEKATIAGAVAGGITGARAGAVLGSAVPIVGTGIGAVAGGAIGSGLGATLGAGADAMLADIDMINKADTDAIVSKMIDAGIAETILGATAPVVGAGIGKLAGGTTSYIRQVWDYLASNNPQGAINAIMTQTNQTREQALEAVRKYEQYIGRELEGSEAQKIAEVSVHTPGSEKLLHGASGTDNSGYITQIANDVFNRANLVREQTKQIVKSEDVIRLEEELLNATANRNIDRVADIKLELQDKDMYSLVVNDLQNYSNEVKDIYRTVKDAPAEYLKDYKFDINDLAIEPLLKTSGKYIADETIRNRWLGRLSKIEDLSNGNKSFQDLQELYKYVNQLERDTPRANIIDKSVITDIKNNISKEIKLAADTHIPAADKWLEAWSTANKQYSVMKTMEENVLYKALHKPGISAEDITKQFLKFSDAGDDTFYKVMDKLPKESQTRVEGALFQHLLDSRTSGIDTMKAIDFPVLADDLSKIKFRSPELQQTANHISHMAQVFKNDINLARASGLIATPHFQSYLTTDPVVRAKFMAASHIFNRISQLKPGESADNFAAYKLLSEVFKNPLDQSSIKLLDSSLNVKDRRVTTNLLDTNELLNDMQNQYIQRREGLRQIYNSDNIPPLLVWKSNPEDLAKLQNPEATILPSVDSVLYASTKGKVATNPSDANLEQRASDLFTEFIWKNAPNSKLDIQDYADGILNSKRYDDIIKTTRRTIENSDRIKSLETINKVVDRETKALAYKIRKDLGVQLPQSEIDKLKKIQLLKFKE